MLTRANPAIFPRWTRRQASDIERLLACLGQLDPVYRYDDVRDGQHETYSFEDELAADKLLRALEIIEAATYQAATRDCVATWPSALEWPERQLRGFLADKGMTIGVLSTLAPAILGLSPSPEEGGSGGCPCNIRTGSTKTGGPMAIGWSFTRRSAPFATTARERAEDRPTGLMAGGGRPTPWRRRRH